MHWRLAVGWEGALVHRRRDQKACGKHKRPAFAADPTDLSVKYQTLAVLNFPPYLDKGGITIIVLHCVQ